MYLWRKLAARRWLAAHEQALRALAREQLALIEQPNRRRIELEVASKSRLWLDKLVVQFGGRIQKLPRDWLKRCLREQETKPLRIRNKALFIPAGAAFGSGEHATTTLCLRLLSGVCRCWGARAPRPLFSAPAPKSPFVESSRSRGRDRQRARRPRSPQLVLDLGTGSGILALAARLLGAKRVIGIDNDPLAIATAEQNARRNQVDYVQFCLADVRRWKPPRDVDLVTANLFSEVLIEIVPKLRRVPRLILSGILREQERQVARALKQHKIDILEVRRRGKWVAVLAAARLR